MKVFISNCCCTSPSYLKYYWKSNFIPNSFECSLPYAQITVTSFYELLFLHLSFLSI